MAFKNSQLPKDAINTKEIDSIYKFLAHVSNNNLTITEIFWALILDRLVGAFPARRDCLPCIELPPSPSHQETDQLSRDTFRRILWVLEKCFWENNVLFLYLISGKYWSYGEDQCLDGRELQEISGASVFRQPGNVHLSDLLCPSAGQLCHHPGQYPKWHNSSYLQYWTLQINWFIYSGNLLVEVKRKELLATQQSSEEKKKED